MMAGKMKDLKTSIKRIYTRFVVLTAVVVFGAIALAQAQKGEGPAEDAVFAIKIPQADEPVVPLPAPGGPAGNEPAALPGTASSAAPIETVVSDVVDQQPVQPVDFRDEADDYQDLRGFDDPPAASDLEPVAESEFYAEPQANLNQADLEPISDLPDYDDDYTDDDLESATLPDVSDVGAEAPPLLESRPLAAAPVTNEFEPVEDYAAADDLASDDFSEAGGFADDRFDSGVALPDQEPQPQRELPPQRDLRPQPVANQADHQGPPRQAVADVRINNSRFGGDRAPTNPHEASRDLRSRGETASFDARFDRGTAADASVTAANGSNLVGVGKPGPQSLEGVQTPTLTLQKSAPKEVQVGQPAKFEIRVRNVGRVPADNVIIRDEIPAGTEYVDANPKPTQAEGGQVMWHAGTLPPGQEVTVSLQLMPITEGLVGSVATIAFEASASARTQSTKPGLVLEHSGPLTALVGEPVRFAIKLSNPGSGVATNVVLEEDVPVGLSHSSGNKLEYEVGAIQPGQTRHLELTLKAAQAGHVINRLVARADGGLDVEDEVELDVIAPKLQVAIDGPNRRYLGRQATFTVTVANPGSAAARDVELTAFVPEGLRFVSTNNSGYYDQTRNAVVWSLEQLPAGEMGRAQFTAMPNAMGSFQVRAEGRANAGLSASEEHAVQVEGIAALFFSLADKVDPVEVGGQTTYEIKVVNQGSKDATNVKLVAIVPDGMQPIGSQGPTGDTIRGQQVQFAPLGRLAPKGEATFRISVRGQSPGDHRFRVQLTSDEITTPVIKEESTRIYAD